MITNKDKQSVLQAAKETLQQQEATIDGSEIVIKGRKTNIFIKIIRNRIQFRSENAVKGSIISSYAVSNLEDVQDKIKKFTSDFWIWSW